MKVTTKDMSSWKAWAAVVGAVVGLWGLAAARIAREASAPERRAPPTAADPSGSASRVEGLRPLQLAPPDTDAGEEDLDVCAAVDAAGDEEMAGMTELPPVEATEPELDADVRTPPPPEAFLPMPPRARSPDQDTGLAFRSEPFGDGATREEEENEKEVNPSGAQDPTNGPPPPRFTADLRPAPDPEALATAPSRTTPDRDTGSVFSNQRPRATDAGDEKY